MALAGVVATSCTQEHIEAQFVPGNVVAPVLGTIEGTTLAEDGANITVEYTKADFGVATASTEALYTALDANMADQVKIAAEFKEGTITFTQKDLNTAILNLGADAQAEIHSTLLSLQTSTPIRVLLLQAQSACRTSSLQPS